MRMARCVLQELFPHVGERPAFINTGRSVERWGSRPFDLGDRITPHTGWRVLRLGVGGAVIACEDVLARVVLHTVNQLGHGQRIVAVMKLSFELCA